MWLTSAPADTRVECWTEESLPATHIDERATVHEAHLAGLAPDTAYHYRVSSAAARSAIHQFRTAPRDARKFRFVLCADTAGAPERLAKLADAILRHDPAFIVHAGNFIRGDATEAAWSSQWFSPAHTLLAGRALVPARGSGERGSSLFARLLPTPSGATWRSHRYLHLEVFALDATEGIAVGDEQYRWLERALARSSAQWKLVVFHGTLLPGTSGSARPELRRALYPLLLRAGVDITFSGGALYARTVPIGSGEKPRHNAIVNFVTSASADAGADPHLEPWLGRAAAAPHFLLVQVDGEELTVQAIDLDGATLDSVTLHKAGTLRERRGALPAEALEALFAFLPPGGFGLGDLGATAAAKEFTVVIEDPYDAPIEGTLRWQAPNRAWQIEPRSLDIRVPPLGHQKLTFGVTVRPPDLDPRPTPAFIAADQRLEARRSPFRVDAAGR